MAYRANLQLWTPGEGALYTLNTFYAQIRPEIQISSFGFNRSLPEVQPEVSVPSYFQFPANRPIRTLPQPKATYVFALASRNNKPVQRQRFNSQCTAHLKEPKVTHITTLTITCKTLLALNKLLWLLGHQHKLISRTTHSDQTAWGTAGVCTYNSMTLEV